MTVGSWSKNTAGSTQGGCLVEYLGRVASVGTGKMGELAPVFGLHFPVELAERVELDLPQRGLESLLILRTVGYEDCPRLRSVGRVEVYTTTTHPDPR